MKDTGTVRMIFNMIRFHKPEEENGYLSNWYMSSFSLDDKTYCCVEQYMMERKAIMFANYDIAEQIMKTTDPQTMQKLGRTVTNFNQMEWDGKKQLIVYKAIIAKFEQNIELMGRLLSTGTATFVECSKSDKVWGIGLGMDDDISDMSKWNGQNLLGFALCEARAELMKRVITQNANRKDILS